jgi:hypothetical protein
MPRVNVLERIERIMTEAPIGKYKLPPTYTNLDLARMAYEVEAPSAAQLSAVRRALARLIQEGVVLREAERAAWTQGGRGTHLRYADGDEQCWSWEARNPPRVKYARPLTVAEQEARNAYANRRLAEITDSLRKSLRPG